MMRLLRDALFRIAMRDGRTKVMALVVAAIAFHSIRNVISEERYFRARILPEMPQDAGVTVVNADPGEARVTLRGSRDQLNAIREEELVIKASPERSTSGSGSEYVALRPARIEGHRQTRVLNIEPSTVRLAFDVEGDVRLSVARPKLKGTPLIGNAEVVWAETNVVVRGPLNQLTTLRDNAVQLATEEIDVDGRVQSFSRRVKIILPKDIGNVRVGKDEVEVRVAIKVDTETRVFENIPVLLTAVTGSGVTLTSDPATISIRVTGMADRLNQLRPELISVIADCRNIAVSRETVAAFAVRVYLPPGLEGLSTEAVPDKVTVHARRVGESEPAAEPTVRTEAVGPVSPTP
jgi:autonomous glycyl radical cofactor GrcA